MPRVQYCIRGWEPLLSGERGINVFTQFAKDKLFRIVVTAALVCLLAYLFVRSLFNAYRG